MYISFLFLFLILIERLEEISAISSAEIAAGAKECLTSDWLPSQILGGPEAREKIERSWVGTYVIGKDYWNDIEEEDASEKEARKASNETVWLT